MVILFARSGASSVKWDKCPLDSMLNVYTAVLIETRNFFSPARHWVCTNRKFWHGVVLRIGVADIALIQALLTLKDVIENTELGLVEALPDRIFEPPMVPMGLDYQEMSTTGAGQKAKEGLKHSSIIQPGIQNSDHYYRFQQNKDTFTRGREYSVMLSSPRGLSLYGRCAEPERQSAVLSEIEPIDLVSSDIESWELPIDLNDFDLDGLDVGSSVSWNQLIGLSPLL